MLLDRGNPIFTMNRRVSLRDLNPHLMCVLCGGYFVDATTIIECVHSFCRSCIVKHLESSKYCPICEVMVHKTKPLMNIRRDKTLQDIVYKLVPGLFAREMLERRTFYKDRPHYVKPDDVESGGEVSEERKSYICDDSITLSLTDNAAEHPPWFLRCPVGVAIDHLKKLVLAKYGFRKGKVHVDIMLKNQLLDDDLTLLDISCLYPWRSKDILDFTYVMLAVNEKKEPPESNPVPVEDNIETMETEKVSEDVVEKEIQLQITESGVMSVSEIDTRQGSQALDQVIGCSMTELSNSLVGCSKEPTVPSEPKRVDQEKDLRPKRPSTDVDAVVVKPKRPSFRPDESTCRKTEEKPGLYYPKPVSYSPLSSPGSANITRESGLSRSTPSERVSGETSKCFPNNVNIFGKGSSEARHVPSSSGPVYSSNQVPRKVVTSETFASKVPHKSSTPKETCRNLMVGDPPSPNTHVVAGATSSSKDNGCNIPVPSSNSAGKSVTHGTSSPSNKNEKNGVAEGVLIPKEVGRNVSAESLSTFKEDGRAAVAADSSALKEGGRCGLVTEKLANYDGVKPADPVPPGSSPGSVEQKSNKFKAIRSTPEPWRPVITKEKLRPTLMASTEEPRKPGKFFKMRNMPRFLGNPASGVKPMYSNGLSPASPPSPSRKVDQIVRIDPKTLRPMQQEENKTPNALLTSPYIPRDNRFQLPDPKTQPYSKINFPPGFHASLPPSISLLMNPHQHFRNLKAREEAHAKLCDNSEPPRPSASASNSSEPEFTPAPAVSAAPETPTKCL